MTVLTCTNAFGSFQLPLLVIGKSVKPHALKNYNFGLSPVEYKNQRNASLDVHLFQDGFLKNLC